MKFKVILYSKSGSILLVTIWILIILTVLSVGIGHRNSIGLKLNRYSIDKLKSAYIAKAGLQHVIEELETDEKDYDILYECGFSLDEEKTLEDIFKDIEVGEGSYSVGYEENSEFSYGLIDEERKINLNAVNAQNYEVLQNLLELLDVDSDAAEIIASSICDWHDADSNVTNPPYGAEDDYYVDLDKPYHCKNSRFEAIEELFLVRSMNKEIFLKIKDYVSVYGETNLKVNVNTASALVLQAFGDEALDHLSSGSPSDVDGMVNKIIDYRAGDDNIEKTADDGVIDFQNPLVDYTTELNLFGEEGNLFIDMKDDFFITKSDYFRAKIQGVYKDRKVISEIEVVLSRGGLSPIYWHED